MSASSPDTRIIPSVPAHSSMRRWHEFHEEAARAPVVHKRLDCFLKRFHEIFLAFDPIDAYRLADRDHPIRTLPSALRHFDVPLGGIRMLRLPIETMARELVVMERLLSDGTAVSQIHAQSSDRIRKALDGTESPRTTALLLHVSVIDDIIDSLSAPLQIVGERILGIRAAGDSAGLATKEAARAFAGAAERTR
jgi:hypothetical protein